MKKVVVGLAIVILLLAVVGCSRSSVPSPNAPQGGVTTPAATRAIPATSAPPLTVTQTPAAKYFDTNSGLYFNTQQQLQQYQASHPGATGTAGNTPNLPSTDRMVVRTGNLDLVVSDIPTVLDNITKIAADLGGYVVTSQKSKDGQRLTGSISIRVLAENYDKAISSLRALAMDVITETSSSQDVTQEYIDLDSQVKNLEATEALLLKIMASATKTEDVLSVQRELTNVQGQIEQDKGRMQYLERTSATSLIQIKLKEAEIEVKFNADKVDIGTEQSTHFTAEVTGGFAPYHYQWDFGDGNTSNENSPTHSYKNPGIYNVVLKVTDDKGYTNSVNRNAYINVTGSWSPASIAGSAWNGFTAFGRVFVDILIWLGIFSPVWIVIGGIVIWSQYRRKRRA